MPLSSCLSSTVHALHQLQRASMQDMLLPTSGAQTKIWCSNKDFLFANIFIKECLLGVGLKQVESALSQRFLNTPLVTLYSVRVVVPHILSPSLSRTIGFRAQVNLGTRSRMFRPIPVGPRGSSRHDNSWAACSHRSPLVLPSPATPVL